MVVDVGDSSGIAQISVEELQMLAQAVFGGHASPQTIVAVLYGPAGGFTVDTD